MSAGLAPFLAASLDRLSHRLNELDAALAEVVNNRSVLYAPEVVDAAVRLIQEKGYQLPT